MLEGLWWLSYGAIWLLAIVQVLAILALARQIGVLQVRLPPVGARIGNAGLELGDEAPIFHEEDLRGRLVSLGAGRGKPTLLIFLSPHCSICRELAPAVRALYRRERSAMEIALISPNKDEKANYEFAESYRLADLPFLRSPRVADDYHVAVTPYAILVDAAGKIYTKGMVNNAEHLESLLNAFDAGVPSLDRKRNLLKMSKGTAD